MANFPRADDGGPGYAGRVPKEMLDEEQLHAIRSSPRGKEFHNRLAEGATQQYFPVIGSLRVAVPGIPA